MDNSIPSFGDGPVLVLGASGVDVVGRLRSELTLQTSNPAHIRTSFGGVARNVAENLARLGQPAVLLSAVGEDSAGDQLLAATAQAGVDTSHVLRVEDCPTGAYLAVLSSHGALELALDDMRAVASITPEYVREQSWLFKEASILFIDANLPKATLRTTFSLARRARLPVCADPTASGLATRLRTYLDRLFMVVPNGAEASILCGQAVDAASRRKAMSSAKCLVSQGVQVAIITLGEFGVVYATSETSGQIPAIRTEVVDPTGAGDALTAAVIFGLLNDMPLDDAIRLGVSAATLTLRCPGAVVPDLTLEKLYDQLVI